MQSGCDVCLSFCLCMIKLQSWPAAATFLLLMLDWSHYKHPLSPNGTPPRRLSLPGRPTFEFCDPLVSMERLSAYVHLHSQKHDV